MEATELLLAANAVVWLGVCGYIAFLAGQTRQIRRRLQQLEHREDSDVRGDR
ncbi:MAG: CcmD family protein [Desulfohalobiaceae bacterium]